METFPAIDGQTDEFLLQRFRSGDARAFGAFACRHWAAVSRLAWLIAGRSAAGPIVASAFLRLREGALFIPRGEPVRFTLYRHVIDGALSGPAAEQERLVDVQAAVARLHDVDRMAFILRRVERVSDGEAAAILMLRPEDVRRRSRRFELELAKRIDARRGAQPLRRAARGAR